MVVPKVVRGSNLKGLMRYLLGPGADDRNPHRDPRVIASWRGDLEVDSVQATQLGGQLDELAQRHGHGETAKRVWHGSLRAAPGDRVLGDAQWAEAAEQLISAKGLEGCRWVAVRHDDDHVHVAAVMVGRDGRREHVRHDYRRSAEAARAIEQRFGLAQVESPDRSARPERSRTDERVASRLGLDQPVGAELRDRVSAAAAASSSRANFTNRCAASGVQVVAARWPAASPATAVRTRRASRCGTRPVGCASTCPTGRWIAAGGPRPPAVAIPPALSTASPHSSPLAGWTPPRRRPPSPTSPASSHASCQGSPGRRCGWLCAPATGHAPNPAAAHHPQVEPRKRRCAPWP
jgi:hypothetical protein